MTEGVDIMEVVDLGIIETGVSSHGYNHHDHMENSL